MLQFEVLKERLLNEYNVKTIMRAAPFRVARWLSNDPEGLAWAKGRRDCLLVEDRNCAPVLLAESTWPLQYASEKAPKLKMYDVEPL